MRSSANPKYIVNVEGIVEREGRYLMVERSLDEPHAPGTLTFPGGKVEGEHPEQDVLEHTLRREIREETGVEIAARLDYLESKSFVTDDGEPVVDIVFLCRYRSGEIIITDQAEVAGLAWMTLEEVLSDPRAMPWTIYSLRLAEALSSNARSE